MTFRTINNDIHYICSERSNQATNLRRERRMNLTNKRRMELIQSEDRTDNQIPIETIRSIVNDVNQGNVNKLHELLQLINGDEVVQKILFESQVMKSIIQMIPQCYQNYEMMFDIISIFINYSSDEKMYSIQLVHFGLFDYYSNLLQHPIESIAIHSLWLLCNLCSDGNEIKKVIIEKGIIDVLPLFFENHKNEQSKSYLIWFFSNLTKFENKESCILSDNHFFLSLQFSLMCLDDQNKEIVLDALHTLQNISLQDKYIELLVQNNEVVNKLLNFMTHQTQSLSIVTLKIISNITFLETERIFEISRFMIPKLIALTEHNNPLILKEVYMVLSNIIAMKQDDMLESILKTPLINTITNSIYRKLVEPKIILEMGFCICNICYVSKNKHLVFILQNFPITLPSLFLLCEENLMDKRQLLFTLRVCKLMIKFCADNGIEIQDVIEESGFSNTLDDIIYNMDDIKITNIANEIKQNYIKIDFDSWN